MKHKTPVIGILIWVVLAALISIEAMEIIYGLLKGTNLYSPFIAGCAAGVAFLLIFVAGTCANECHKRFAREKENANTRYYIGGVLLLILSVIAVVAVYFTRFQTVTFFPESGYSALAVVGQGGFFVDSSIDTVPGGRLYLYFLHGLYYLFGNKESVVVYSQFLLYIIDLIVIFFTVNSMAGIYSGALSMALFGCLTRSFNATLTADPVLLLTIAVFLPLMILGFVVRAASRGKYKHPFLAIMFCCVIVAIFVFAAELAPYFVEFGFHSGVLQDFTAFRFGGLLSGEYVYLWNRPDSNLVLTCLLFVGAILGLFRFLYKKEAVGLFLPLGLLICLSVASFSLNPVLFTGISAPFWCAVSGQGLGWLFTPETKSASQSEKQENAETETKTEVSPVLGDSEPDNIEETITDFDDNKTVTSEKQSPVPEKPVVKANRYAEPGKPLPNPLPVPKKKERKESNYPQSVPEEKLCFDVEIDENDDFDLT